MTKPEFTTHNKLLDNIVSYLNKYLTIKGANEIIINNPKEVIVDVRGKYEYHRDEILTAKYLENFLSLLASEKGEVFDKFNTFYRLQSNSFAQSTINKSRYTNQY
jgi:type IV secretory pathway ATPase VirB11/archaellum biosynthesis ATPase